MSDIQEELKEALFKDLKHIKYNEEGIRIIKNRFADFIEKKERENLVNTEFTKGYTDEPIDDNSFYGSGISTYEHTNKITVYADTSEEAERLRDFVLTAIHEYQRGQQDTNESD